MALTTACGREQVRQADPDESWLPLTVLEGSEPDVYPLFDPACQNQNLSDETPLASANVNVWRDGDVTLSELDLTPLQLTGQPLSSQSVSRVTFDALFERTCDSSHAAPPACRDHRDHPTGWQVQNNGRPLKICTASISPPRKSIEHLALATVVAIEKTGRSLKKFLPEIFDIAPVEVLAMPRFDTRWTPWTHNGSRGHYLTHVTDNLAYFADTDVSKPYIAVFPRSSSNTTGINLWESEFVLAHEFAHHVERKLSLDRFGQSASKIRMAASEAFADSLAFASQQVSSRSIAGIPCVGQDRSPEQLAFTNGTAKIIDDQLMRLLQGGDSSASSKDSSLNCQGVVPYSPHGVGTIFAHWLYEFVKDIPHYDENPGQSLALLTVAWLRHVDQTVTKDEQPVAVELTLLAKALEAAVEDRYKNLEIDLGDNMRIMLCQKMSLAFPALKDRLWFSRTDC